MVKQTGLVRTVDENTHTINYPTNFMLDGLRIVKIVKIVRMIASPRSLRIQWDS